MAHSVRELIGSQPILAIFLAIGLGYAVGQISVIGFSLGAERCSSSVFSLALSRLKQT